MYSLLAKVRQDEIMLLDMSVWLPAISVLTIRTVTQEMSGITAYSGG